VLALDAAVVALRGEAAVAAGRRHDTQSCIARVREFASSTKELTMKIAVIGAGNVGGTLGKRWAKAGHEVAFGARDPAEAKVAALVRESGPSARAASVPDAARQAAVVALTRPVGERPGGPRGGG
jgi:lactate dehydrogenase-like 2-hydroxyacid dehydrogenase